MTEGAVSVDFAVSLLLAEIVLFQNFQIGSSRDGLFALHPISCSALLGHPQCAVASFPAVVYTANPLRAQPRSMEEGTPRTKRAHCIFEAVTTSSSPLWSGQGVDEGLEAVDGTLEFVIGSATNFGSHRTDPGDRCSLRRHFRRGTSSSDQSDRPWTLWRPSPVFLAALCSANPQSLSLAVSASVPLFGANRE